MKKQKKKGRSSGSPKPKRLSQEFWPASLAHLAKPFLRVGDEYVIVGEVSDEPQEGFPGTRLLYTALVPRDQAREALNATGGIGQGIRCHGPQPIVDTSAYNTSFWIDGPQGSNLRYETLVNGWTVHNREVLVPDNGFLMCYGLVPRYGEDGQVFWDDPRLPRYTVVRNIPQSLYDVQSGRSTARIEILRDYLEDFLSLKGAVAIATYFEERHSASDPIFDSVVGEGRKEVLKGRTLWLKEGPWESGSQLSQVWGTKLLMSPKGRPISDGKKLVLKWPDRPKPVVGRGRMGGFATMETVFVEDRVLEEFENRTEFNIHPQSGAVSYGSWWSVSHCHRVGRNHIAVELRKLYEGAPQHVIKHFHGFAVKGDVAQRDQEKHAREDNIGARADNLIDAYSSLVRALKRLTDLCALDFTEEDIGIYSTSHLKYHGWWTIEELNRLGNIAPTKMTFSDFLSRCKDLMRLLENLKIAPLRNLVTKLGLDKEKTKDFANLKLLAGVCQLSTISKKEGLSLYSDCNDVVRRWNHSTEIPALKSLFAINELRVKDAHSAAPRSLTSPLRALGIDVAACRAGWGKALDNAYDQLTAALNDISKLLNSST